MIAGLAVAMDTAITPVLRDLAVVLLVAGVTTFVCQLLRQPVVLGYLVAGLIVGRHTPPRALVGDEASIRGLADLGVVMLMFSLGLELTFRKLMRVGPTAILVTVIEVALMLWLGYATGLAFGWGSLESLFLGSLLAISSTTIIVKAYHDEHREGRAANVVFGILVMEDLVAVLLIAVLTALATGSGSTGSTALTAAGRLALFLAGAFGVGLFIVPRLIRKLVSIGSRETTLVVSVGFCFGLALVCEELGYSPALGAFLAGMLVAESGHGRTIEQIVQPVRDVFAAIFFVSTGMLLNPAVIPGLALPIIAILALTIVGKVASAAVGSFLAGESVRTSLAVGMSLAQIGEFSFVIAQLGTSLGVARDSLLTIAIAVSAITTFLTPYFIRGSAGAAEAVDRRLPRAFQTFVTLYGTWIESLRSRRAGVSSGSRTQRRVLLLIVDASALAGIAIATSLGLDDAVDWVSARVSANPRVVTGLVVAAASILGIPFLFGAFRCARGIALDLASAAVPHGGAAVDLGRAPRRALIATLQLAILALVGIPLLLLTQPFLPPFGGALVLLAILAASAVAFWRSVRDVHGHMRAGAEVIVASLAKQMAAADSDRALDEIESQLSGVGNLARVEIRGGEAAGQTLGELNVRGVTGATVLAILRDSGSVVNPRGGEALRDGDKLILTGTEPALEEARRLLGGPAGA